MTPRLANLHLVTTPTQLRYYFLRYPWLNAYLTGSDWVWPEASWEMTGMCCGGVKCFLNIHAEYNIVEEELECPLVLFVSSRCAEHHVWVSFLCY